MAYLPRRVPRHEQLTIRGLRHRLTWWGEPGGAPLVLLHGWMDNGATWQFLVDRLPPDWSCVAPDWRGFGDSERAPGGYWFPDYFADLEALLEQLVPGERARVVGHSMGGNIAAMYAGIRPQRLAWLVNLEGLGLPRTAADEAPGHYARWLDQLRAEPRAGRYPSRARLATVLRTRNPRLDAPRAEFLAQAWTRPEGDEVELTADPRHRDVNPVLYRRDEAEACWRRIEVPMLLLVGELSEYRERLGADGTDASLRERMPTARITTLPGVGHMMHHEDPQRVADEIVAFARSPG